MSRISSSRKRAALVAAAAMSAGIVGGLWHTTHTRPSIVDWTVAEVPAARALLTPQGSEFALGEKGQIATRRTGVVGSSLSVIAPSRATEEFNLAATGGGGGGRVAKVSLAGAADVSGRVEHGSVGYEDAYEDVDVVSGP